MRSDDITGTAADGRLDGDGGLDGDTVPHERECVLCYVYRMLARGCDNTLRWAKRWRDRRAPRRVGLERQLQARGGYCDCEIFMNGWKPCVTVKDAGGDLCYPEHMPPCQGVAAGSAQPCPRWEPLPRWSDGGYG